MPSPTGKPEPPVMCCGSFQADEKHFVYDEACREWKCAIKAAVSPPKPLAEPPSTPAPKAAPKPRTTRTARKKS